MDADRRLIRYVVYLRAGQQLTVFAGDDAEMYREVGAVQPGLVAAIERFDADPDWRLAPPVADGESRCR